MTVDASSRDSTLRQVCTFFDVQTSTNMRRCWYAQRQLVQELNGTNVQLFHFRVEGRAFHSQSIGCTRCATYDSARVFQSLKDELALDLWGHLARRGLCVTSQFAKRNLQD